jgi:hypothetical protein
MFANQTFVAAVCSSLVLCALGIGLFSTSVLWRTKRDAKQALVALSNGSADPRSTIASLPSSPISARLLEELDTIKVIEDRSYRVPCARSNERFDGLVHLYADTRTLDAWPNIFVGVGLLLTFVGLALSLWNASRGAASGDIAVVKQSVTTLLEFSAVKFTTSLVALLCSILLSIVLRKQRHLAEVTLDKVARALEHSHPSITIERLAVYQLSDSFRDQQHRDNAAAMLAAFSESSPLQLAIQNVEDLLGQAREQTAQLQSFNSNLAIQLGEALDSKLQPMLQHLADRVELALRDMGGSIGDTNQSALKSLLDSFVDELRGATKNDSAEVQRNLSELASTLGRTSSELSERMSSVFSGVESTGERFAAMLNDASASFRGEMGRVQADVGSGLTDALAAIKASADQSSRQSEAILRQISAGADSFRSSVEGGATSFVSELDRGAKSIDTIVERLGDSVIRLAELIEKASTLGDNAARITAERMGQLQSTLHDVDAGFKRVNDATVPFSKAADQVRTAIDLLRVTETSVQSRVVDFTSAATAMMTSSSGLSDSVSKSVSRLTEGLGSSTERLTSSITTIAQQSEQAGSTLRDAIRETLSEYEKRFGSIDNELQNALTTIVETFASTYEAMRARVADIDQQMAQSINRLANFNETFGEHTEDLAHSVEKLSLTVARRA